MRNFNVRRKTGGKRGPLSQKLQTGGPECEIQAICPGLVGPGKVCPGLQQKIAVFGAQGEREHRFKRARVSQKPGEGKATNQEAQFFHHSQLGAEWRSLNKTVLTENNGPRRRRGVLVAGPDPLHQKNSMEGIKSVIQRHVEKTDLLGTPSDARSSNAHRGASGTPTRNASRGNFHEGGAWQNHPAPEGRLRNQTPLNTTSGG